MLGFFVDQSEFVKLFLLYTAAFALYIFIFYSCRNRVQLLFAIAVAVASRFILIFAFPSLSDDIYRFLWDGKLINLGVNPFSFTPQEFMSSSEYATDPWFGSIFPQLNSADYYSIYPPVCQWLFSTTVKIFPNDWYWASVFLKSIFACIEIGTLYVIFKLLPLLKLPPKRILLYALNPLIILELVGNLHFEAIMIFFLIFSLWFLIRHRPILFGLSFALSVATKLVPLIFGPLLLFRMRWKQIILGFGTAAVVLVALFIPVFRGQIDHFASSLDLYFRTFEFNASIYYLMRWVGFQLKGYNTIHSIGPILSIVSFVLILLIAYFRKRKNYDTIFKAALVSYSVYLWFATTVHPWYVSIPIILCLFTYFRFPIIWSYVVMWSYVHYWGDVQQENYWIIFLEYAIVFTVAAIELGRFPIVKLFASRGYGLLRWIRNKKGDQNQI